MILRSDTAILLCGNIATLRDSHTAIKAYSDTAIERYSDTAMQRDSNTVILQSDTAISLVIVLRARALVMATYRHWEFEMRYCHALLRTENPRFAAARMEVAATEGTHRDHLRRRQVGPEVLVLFIQHESSAGVATIHRLIHHIAMAVPDGDEFLLLLILTCAFMR